MAVPAKNLAIGSRFYVLRTDAVSFPFAWASRQSPSVCPCQPLVTPNLVVVMGNTGAFTISWLWLVFSPRRSFPCFFDSAIGKCHFAPPPNSILALCYYLSMPLSKVIRWGCSVNTWVIPVLGGKIGVWASGSGNEQKAYWTISFSLGLWQGVRQCTML